LDEERLRPDRLLAQPKQLIGVRRVFSADDERRIDEAFALFRQNSLPELPCSHLLVQARYAYLWSRYGDAKQFLRPMLDWYRKLRILDDHFLYMRGLPFFGEWWACFAAVCALAGDWDEISALTEELAATCSDFDFDELRLKLEALRTGNYGSLAEHLNNRPQLPAGMTGYRSMRAAAALARVAVADPAEGRRLISDVRLDANDFGWLEDVRTVWLASLARREGKAALEATLQDAFLQKQPLLFEPNHALNFMFLEYQEQLKVRYQTRTLSS